MVIGCSDTSKDGRKLIFCSKEVKESAHAKIARGCCLSTVIRPGQAAVAVPKSQFSAHKSEECQEYEANWKRKKLVVTSCQQMSASEFC